MYSSVCFCNDFILSVKGHVDQLNLLFVPPQNKLEVGVSQSVAQFSGQK